MPIINQVVAGSGGGSGDLIFRKGTGSAIGNLFFDPVNPNFALPTGAGSIGNRLQAGFSRSSVITSFDVSSSTSGSFQTVCQGCTNLTRAVLNIGAANDVASKYSGAFNGCVKLQELDCSGVTNVTYGTFQRVCLGCALLEEINLKY